MTKVPEHPKIYHLTHVDNLAGIIHDGVLWSDAEPRNLMKFVSLTYRTLLTCLTCLTAFAGPTILFWRTRYED